MSHEIPVSKAVLDASDAMVKRVEDINLAIIDLVRSCNINDPVLATLLGTNIETLKLLHETSKRKLTTLAMTSVPLFSLRLGSTEFYELLKDDASDEHLFRSLLKSFESEVNLRSL